MKASKTVVKPLTALDPKVGVATEFDVCGLAEVFDLLKRTSEDEGAELVGLITDLAAKRDKKACVVIDEANRVAKAGTDTDLLAKIINETKTKFQLSVMLCTSVHSYPGVTTELLNLENAASSYVEEFSPTVMKQILTSATNTDGTKVVGMGPNLTR